MQIRLQILVTRKSTARPSLLQRVPMADEAHERATCTAHGWCASLERATRRTANQACCACGGMHPPSPPPSFPPRARAVQQPRQSSHYGKACTSRALAPLCCSTCDLQSCAKCELQHDGATEALVAAVAGASQCLHCLADAAAAPPRNSVAAAEVGGDRDHRPRPAVAAVAAAVAARPSSPPSPPPSSPSPPAVAEPAAGHGAVQPPQSRFACLRRGDPRCADGTRRIRRLLMRGAQLRRRRRAYHAADRPPSHGPTRRRSHAFE